MRKTDLEKKIRAKLATEGIKLEPGSPADRGVKAIAKAGADLATSGDRALQDIQNVLNRAADAAREAIHNATKPPPRRPKR